MKHAPFVHAYPENPRCRSSIQSTLYLKLVKQIRAQPVILNRIRHKLLRVITQQRRILDKSTVSNQLPKVRRQLMQQGFKIALVGQLLVLLEHYLPEEISDKVSWATWLMLKGYAVNIRGIEKAQAMQLCASIAALSGIPVHWIVSDEMQVTALAKQHIPFWQQFGIETAVILFKDRNVSAIYTQPIVIGTVECFAWHYLRDRQVMSHNQPSYLKLLLHNLGQQRATLRIPRLSFALIENIDFWLLEQAFTTFAIGDSIRITLHELFQRYHYCSGNLLGTCVLNQALWNYYQIIPIDLSRHTQSVTSIYNLSFFDSTTHKWEAITAQLIQSHQNNEKICVMTTDKESTTQLQIICNKLMFSINNIKTITHKSHPPDLILLDDPFPWFKLPTGLNNIAYRLIIIDFCNSLRLWHYLKQIADGTSITSVDLIFSSEDKWLKQIYAPTIHKKLNRLLAVQKIISGKLAQQLLEQFLATTEAKQKKLHGEMDRWLWQITRTFSG
ncbi:MAG: hypothetical protein HC877_16150 [Thioploca sp.]|nr:hypothetical protein [Thioploca sp.]